MTGPRYPALIASLPATVPFVGPELQERERGAKFRARLGANESVFGPSPFAIAAMQDEAVEAWKYADPSHIDLKAALAEEMACTPDNILIAEGIDGLLGYTARLMVEQGDAVVTSDGAYPTFNYHVTGFGGVLHKVPYAGDHENLAGLIDKAAEVDAKLLYLANPDNPMGTWHSGAAIEAALDRLPEGCVMVLDEAYIEFAPEGTAPNIDPEDARVLRYRTFSKGFGLAGMRVGYVCGAAATIRAFDKIRNHFGMTRLGLAGALAALGDREWLDEVVRLVEESRDEIGRIVQANGLTPLPSATNFVAVDCGRDGDFARRVLAELIAEGVFVRMPFVAPQDRCIRISAGRPEDLKVLAEALPVALKRARDGD
ncbi:pyridoxal phosphate-dependent aminotransferase [Antarctobacter jejuensis]|uniref:pyridoxal phosphate-dependent aminotransferase n=1 Tax=Antarctobacter jejuensis TaxID=1439938 RepID=UPI003FD611B2